MGERGRSDSAPRAHLGQRAADGALVSRARRIHDIARRHRQRCARARAPREARRGSRAASSARRVQNRREKVVSSGQRSRRRVSRTERNPARLAISGGRAALAMRDLPGFYWDEERQRYFALAQEHVARGSRRCASPRPTPPPPIRHGRFSRRPPPPPRTSGTMSACTPRRPREGASAVVSAAASAGPREPAPSRRARDARRSPRVDAGGATIARRGPNASALTTRAEAAAEPPPGRRPPRSVADAPTPRRDARGTPRSRTSRSSVSRRAATPRLRHAG